MQQKENRKVKPKVLLIMPNFFNYPHILKQELIKMGYEVDFFDDRPSTNPWMKAAVRFKRDIVKNVVKKYFNSMMNTISSNTYDYVFLISGQSLSFSKDMIRQLREKQSSAQFILYQWDSVKNFPYIRQMYSFFDKIYTFDRRDAKKENISFFPLFYSEKYKKIASINKNKKYDILFVGTAHPQKYVFIKDISEKLKKNYNKEYIYFFFPSRLVYFYRRLFNPEFKKAKIKEFHFTPLTDSQVDKLLSQSKIVLDAPQSVSSGLTIRVIETMGAERKLITTNADVTRYDFYDPQNIYVYDGKKINFDDKFFHTPYKKIDKEIYDKYELKNWLTHILNEE